jgi:phosphatidylglycerol:prolipoprotein diacylglycerol transferase
VFNLRTGGMVAYGGFLGGFIGSFAYLRWKGLPLIPWADVAVPSLASGLLITRIGCYMYGCDFGRPLSENAPGVLKKLGSFPRWAEGTLPEGAGSPAWAQHVRERGLPVEADYSLPVHPTQLYEALLGGTLLVILLVMRKHQRFRGQIFLSFTLMYGAARFCLELIRDDLERGNIPPALAPHVLVPLCLAIFAAAYSFGVAPALQNKTVRLATQVASFVPAVIAFFELRPAQFAAVVPMQLSTSQFIGLATGVAAAIAFAMLYKAALANPKAAMALPDFGALHADVEEEPVAKPKPKKTGPAKPVIAEEGAAEEEADEAKEAAPPKAELASAKPNKKKSKLAKKPEQGG